MVYNRDVAANRPGWSMDDQDGRNGISTRQVMYHDATPPKEGRGSNFCEPFNARPLASLAHFFQGFEIGGIPHKWSS